METDTKPYYKEETMRYYLATKNGKQRVIQVPDGFKVSTLGVVHKPTDEQVIRYLTHYGYTDITRTTDESSPSGR